MPMSVAKPGWFAVCRHVQHVSQAFHAQQRKEWTAKAGLYGTTGDVCSFDEYLSTPEGVAELSGFKRRVAARVERDLQRLRERTDEGGLLFLDKRSA